MAHRLRSHRPIRFRMSPAEQREGLVRMVGELIAKGAIGPSDVDLICSLNDDGRVDNESRQLSPSPLWASKANNAAALACLGSVAARPRVLLALTSQDDAEVEIAQVYLAHRLSDRQSLGELARLFPATGSVEVQRAIAAVLIRADYQALPKPEVARLLSQNRLKSPDGADIIDVLIRRLRAP